MVTPHYFQSNSFACETNPGQVFENDPFAGGGGGHSASAPMVRIGSPMEIKKGSNCPGKIAGRPYSGHALGRMQGRGIVPSVAENTISNGISISQPGGTVQIYDLGNNISVILNSNGKVITVFPGK